MFLACVGGIGALAGFSRTLVTAKKQDQQLYEKATLETVNLLESGHKLAARALAWGTFYAFLGTGTFCYGIWKLSGATNVSTFAPADREVVINEFVCRFQFEEFRQKMGSILPKLTKNSPATSRTEFEGLNDLMEYLSTWGKEK